MNKSEKIMNEIEQIFEEFVRKKDKFPSYKDMKKLGVSRDKIRSHYGGIIALKEKISKNSEVLKENIATVDNIFNENRSISSKSVMNRRFIITTAVAGAKANKNFISALKNYANRNDAQIVIMPCEAVTNSFENKTAVFDKEFNDSIYFFVTKDFQLCSNMSLCSIQVSANQVKPISGLSRIGKRSGTYVFASPKQFLEYFPNGNRRGFNYAIMTPGACTDANYMNDATFVSKRLSYVANSDHTLGAIIVEICEDNRHFHFRQIQADVESGSFTDLGVQYLSNGEIKSIAATVVLGDIHGVNCELSAVDVFIENLAQANIKVDSVFFHDLFDGKTINHHEKTIFSKAKNYNKSQFSLEEEVKETARIFSCAIDNFSKRTGAKKFFVVKSNHDEFLDRYLAEGRYIEDPANHYYSLKIATSLFEDKDVLGNALLNAKIEEEYADVLQEHVANIVFLNRQSSVKLGEIELGVHGDLGMNGAKPSLSSLENIYGKCVVGHNHSAAIQRGVFRVGTMSKLDMDYNRGPSSWTHTNALVYADGGVQLLNYVNGQYFI